MPGNPNAIDVSIGGVEPSSTSGFARCSTDPNRAAAVPDNCKQLYFLQ
jgi:hypothetical protein